MVKHEFKVGDMVMVMSPNEVAEVIRSQGDTPVYDANDDYIPNDDGDYCNDIIISNSPGYTIGMQDAADENEPMKIENVGSRFILINGYYWDPTWLMLYEPKASIPNGILTKLFK